MADLPDIDTSTVSMLTYWNAIDDGGVGTIDPEEVTSDGNILDYTLYDNGLEGTYDLYPLTDYAQSGDPYHANFRVKSDGWMVAWLGRYENFNQNVYIDGHSYPAAYDTAASGWWDFSAWFDTEGRQNNGFTRPDAVDNTLIQAVNSLRQQFSNAGSMTFNKSDAGLYNYWYSTATTLTVLSSGAADNSKTNGFSYTSGTTVHRVVGTGAAGVYDGNGIDFEGTTITSTNDGCYVGVLDLDGGGYIPNAGTEYQHTADFSNATGVWATYALWS